MEERSVAIGFLLRDYLFNVIYINMCLVYQHRCFINKIILKTYQHKTVVCLFHLVLTGKGDFFYIA